MEHQLTSALSTMLKLRLVVFLHFYKHAVENSEKSNVMYDSNMPIWLPDTKFRFYQKQQGCLGILLGCQGRFWNAKRSCSQSLKIKGTPLSTQVTLCQHPLTSEWTKMRGNMGIMGTSDHAYFLTMSSYDQYFFGTQKSESSAF